jgi:hypothetical protein
MKEKGLGRSKKQNWLVTLTLLPYYMGSSYYKKQIIPQIQC